MKKTNSTDFQDIEQDKFLISKHCECIICADIMQDAVILPCSHSFCNDCVWDWIKEKGNCPLCRTFINQPPPKNTMVQEIIDQYFHHDKIPQANTKSIEAQLAELSKSGIISVHYAWSPIQRQTVRNLITKLLQPERKLVLERLGITESYILLANYKQVYNLATN